MQGRLDTAPQFCGVEIVTAVPYRRPRGIRKGGRTPSHACAAPARARRLALGNRNGQGSRLDKISDRNVWCGRALQEAFVDLSATVLHQCIRPLIGACCAPGHHGNQRACVLIKLQTSSGPLRSPGFACAVKTDPPSRLNLSQTSAGKREAMLPHRCLLCRYSSLVRAKGPFLRPGLP